MALSFLVQGFNIPRKEGGTMYYNLCEMENAKVVPAGQSNPLKVIFRKSSILPTGVKLKAIQHFLIIYKHYVVP